MAALAGPEWVLSAWDADQPADAMPEISLVWQDGQLVGSAGCNRYFASPSPVVADTMPGTLPLGPVGATAMECSQADAAVESRYLGALAGVRGFGFRQGRLVLRDAGAGGNSGMLLFKRRAALGSEGAVGKGANGKGTNGKGTGAELGPK